MENMITHFLYYSANNQIITSNINYTSTESPKGEFGILLITTSTQKHPIRCRIRAPGFFHLQSINKLSQKYFLADIVAIIGTLDIVFGEIDR
jgi:NADH:ubiquinone oxidoreductase subunit D